MDYTKIIFVSKENVLLGPMAEWIMKSILMDKSKQIMSRGLVVLFAEPRDQRVTESFSLRPHSPPTDIGPIVTACLLFNILFPPVKFISE